MIEVPIGQLVIRPWQRSIRHCVTPTLSVDAVQLKLTRLTLIAVAVRFDGAVGACVSTVETGVRELTICITQLPLAGAVAL